MPPKGFLLANDDFGDASNAMSSGLWELAVVVPRESGSESKGESEGGSGYLHEAVDVDKYFRVKKGKAEPRAATAEELKANAGKSFSSRPHKLVVNADAYLFRRTSLPV